MSTYVFIHGGCHGGWCWHKVVPLVKKEGHTAVAPDLPGHGQDKTPIAQVTLQACADRVCDMIRQQSEPVILVGHSLAGKVISQAAEQCPDRISTLVYLTATMLQDGEASSPVPEGATASLLGQNLIMSDDGKYVTVREEALKEIFYGDCTDDDVARAKSMVVPEATAILQAPINVTEENYGRIPRIYIECLQDRSIVPEAQKLMYTRTPCQRIISMNTAHSPFLSAPEELVGQLLSIT